MSLHVLSSQASRLFCNTLLAQRPNSLRHWANRCVAAKFAIHRQSPAVGSSTLCTHYRGLDACVKRQDLQGMVWTSLLMLGRVDCLVRIVVTVRGYHLQLLRMCPAICNKKPDYVCARTRSRKCEAVLGPVWQSEHVSACAVIASVKVLLQKKTRPTAQTRYVIGQIGASQQRSRSTGRVPLSGAVLCARITEVWTHV